MSSSRAPRVAIKAVDEDLTLFKDLHKRNQEKHHNIVNLLLHPCSDDFDHSIQFSKIHSEYEKHDYDWLKTPPATPLFPSIEMEANPQQFCVRKEIQKFAGENNITDQAARTRNTKAKPRLGSSTAKLAIPTISSTKNDANKIILDDYFDNHKVTRSRVGSGRAISPLVVSKLTMSLNNNNNNHLGIGFSDKSPPNLRTEQYSSSASCGGGYSSSRGFKVEPFISPLSIKTKAEENNNKNNNKVLGSKMVKKIMNARKSTTILPNYNDVNTTMTKINCYSRSKNTLVIARSAAK